MKKNIILGFIGVIIVGAGLYLWFNREKLFFQGKMELRQSTDYSTSPANPDTTENIPTEENNHGIPPVNGLQITEYDCNQSCENRKNTDYYDYCREICGLNGSNEYADPANQNDCNSLTGLPKDSCIKGKAIKEKNDNLCNEIKDPALKKSCIDRVAEEIVE